MRITVINNRLYCYKEDGDKDYEIMRINKELDIFNKAREGQERLQHDEFMDSLSKIDEKIQALINSTEKPKIIEEESWVLRSKYEFSFREENEYSYVHEDERSTCFTPLVAMRFNSQEVADGWKQNSYCRNYESVKMKFTVEEV